MRQLVACSFGLFTLFSVAAAPPAACGPAPCAPAPCPYAATCWSPGCYQYPTWGRGACYAATTWTPSLPPPPCPPRQCCPSCGSAAVEKVTVPEPIPAPIEKK